MLPNPVNFFAKLIEQETGIIYSTHNEYQLKMRLEEVCKNENIATLEELAVIFQTQKVSLSLKQKLLDISTNNETLFFRDAKCFTAIQKYLLDVVLPKDPSEIKIWSSAASTGQEALTIAMILDEMFSQKLIPDFSILATDISDKAINKCKSGKYTEFEIQRGLPEEKKYRYFTKENDLWKVNPSIQSKIKFSYNNLIRSTVYDYFHIILCRNVLIYQKVEMKKMVISNLSNQLQDNGAIILGAGETLVGLNDELQSQLIDGVSFYKKNTQAKRNIA